MNKRFFCDPETYSLMYCLKINHNQGSIHIFSWYRNRGQPYLGLAKDWYQVPRPSPYLKFHY